MLKRLPKKIGRTQGGTVAKKNARHDTEIRKELATVIDRFANTPRAESPFATYSNGERRSEDKAIVRSQHATAVASITKALKGD